ncbi:MAG: methyltransferase domain-containing protein [Proteobacteria bacterium]|nr:methyltransferase domain-containing protein [Pseudomonadota bacterium]
MDHGAESSVNDKSSHKGGLRSRPGSPGSPKGRGAKRRSEGVRAWSSDRPNAADTTARKREPEPSGLPARRLAVALIEDVLAGGRALDDAMDNRGREHAYAGLEPRDRGFARLVAATVLRRLGSLDAVLARFFERPLPASAFRSRAILLSATAQLLLLGTPRHAAINLAVEQCRADRHAERYAGLTNAVLRRVAEQGPAILEGLDTPAIDIPPWLWQRWVAAYGIETARRIANASLAEAPLDITPRADAAEWATRLNATGLPTGSVRLTEAGRVEDLPGYADGAWWVQDVAAALPARLLGNVEGLDIADLCAAPGGKTAELAAAGARVTAVDLSSQRLDRLEANLARLKLGERVRPIAADILAWTPVSTFDAVLLDAPCLATGTIRRHPDLLHLKRQSDLGHTSALQAQLIARAAEWVKPGGNLVYCVCSLEPDEGEAIVEAFLQANTSFARRPISASEFGGNSDWITASGDLRTLPFHEPAPAAGGMDGFYAARLVRN